MQSSAQTAPDRVSDWLPWRGWRSAEGGNVFLSDASLEWFMRHHRNALIESGQYLPGKGARPAIVGPNFGAAVLNVMRREAVA